MNYLVHSKICWFHSRINPVLKISKNIQFKIILKKVKFVARFIKKGKIKIISISKIKKTNATMKKCIENRGVFIILILNPHSNGLIFSWSEKIFMERDKVRSMMIRDRVRIKKISNLIKII